MTERENGYQRDGRFDVGAVLVVMIGLVLMGCLCGGILGWVLRVGVG